MSSRYEGKPLLRLLELYILDTINCLSEKDRTNLEDIVPKLSSLYKIDGTWKYIISKIMEFPVNMDDLIIAKWNENKQKARNMGLNLDPNDFAIKFTDANFIV